MKRCRSCRGGEFGDGKARSTGDVLAKVNNAMEVAQEEIFVRSSR